jgi:hypothetical protein
LTFAEMALRLRLPATSLLVALLSAIPLGVLGDAAKRYPSGEAYATATGSQVGRISGASHSHRRKGVEDPRDTNAVRCFRANSSLGDSSCNCFGQPLRQQTTDSEAAVITIVVGGWLGAAVDAWILKLLIEEQLGWPTELIPDSDLFAEEGLGVWGALKSGYAMMYPEVRPSIVVSRSVRRDAPRAIAERPIPHCPGLVFARR